MHRFYNQHQPYCQPAEESWKYNIQRPSGNATYSRILTDSLQRTHYGVELTPKDRTEVRRTNSLTPGRRRKTQRSIS
jgi:hypothetical protein